MKLNANILGVLVLLLSTSGCPGNKNEPDSEILIFNESQRNIVFFVDFAVKDDTTMENFPFSLTIENTEGSTIAPERIGKTGGPFLRYFKEDPEELLMLYIFDRDTIETYQWGEIVADYNILKRYEFNQDSLERRDWEVTYP